MSKIDFYFPNLDRITCEIITSTISFKLPLVDDKYHTLLQILADSLTEHRLRIEEKTNRAVFRGAELDLKRQVALIVDKKQKIIFGWGPDADRETLEHLFIQALPLIDRIVAPSYTGIEFIDYDLKASMSEKRNHGLFLRDVFFCNCDVFSIYPDAQLVDADVNLSGYLNDSVIANIRIIGHTTPEEVAQQQFNDAENIDIRIGLGKVKFLPFESFSEEVITHINLSSQILRERIDPIILQKLEKSAGE